MPDWPIIPCWTKRTTRTGIRSHPRNITDAAWRVKRDYDLPEGWEREVFSWLWDHEQGEIENTDDRGGYPSEAALRRAVDGLGYGRIEEE